MSTSAKPFEILADIAERSVKCAAGLPAQDEAVELWSGIGFIIAGQHYVAAMGTVSEILHLPKYTAVPGVKSWMLGVANVRGRLLPIVDLARYFGLSNPSTKNRDKRVLVIEYDDVLSGVVVDSVLGMQYFSAESFKASTPSGSPAAMAPYLKGVYKKNKTNWFVFDTLVLTDDDRFLDVAVRRAEQTV